MKKSDRILVTGGAGFLGSHLIEDLQACGYSSVLAPRASQYDLREQHSVRRLMQDLQPQTVIHLAGAIGGIGANKDNPGRFIYENSLMGLMLIEEARKIGVNKFVCIGTICEYPKFTPVPFREAELWNGYPEETNAPYGIAKRLLLVQGQAYREQYGMNVIHLMPVNLYGPRDNFDLRTCHVIPAMISKFMTAIKTGQTTVELWGDGTPTREFLYVAEAARAIRMATELFDEPQPVNLGAGRDISIKELASLIAELSGFTGNIRWDVTKPNGQPQRRLDVSFAREKFGFENQISFRDGLHQTINWYRESLSGAGVIA